MLQQMFLSIKARIIAFVLQRWESTAFRRYLRPRVKKMKWLSSVKPSTAAWASVAVCRRITVTWAASPRWRATLTPSVPDATIVRWTWKNWLMSLNLVTKTSPHTWRQNMNALKVNYLLYAHIHVSVRVKSFNCLRLSCSKSMQQQKDNLATFRKLSDPFFIDRNFSQQTKRRT